MPRKDDSKSPISVSQFEAFYEILSRMVLSALLGRLLTVRCNDMKLKVIGDLSQLKNLVKLYVRNNEIESLRGVETSPNLTHLYIINNSLFELDSVSRLSKLEKIYAGKNRIQVKPGFFSLVKSSKRLLKDSQTWTTCSSFTSRTRSSFPEKKCILSRNPSPL